RGSVSGKPFTAEELNRLWVANTDAANEISELGGALLSSSADTGNRAARRVNLKPPARMYKPSPRQPAILPRMEELS
ncbi:MAG: hypothetical protein COB65_12940, partial [Thalassobium sp.]